MLKRGVRQAEGWGRDARHSHARHFEGEHANSRLQRHWHHDTVSEGDGIGEDSRFVSWDNGVQSKSPILGAAADKVDGMPTMREVNISSRQPDKESILTDLPDDTISFLEALHVRSHFIHLAGHVTAEDGRPLLDEDARILHMTVEWVDGNGSILDDELARASRGQWGIANLQGGIGFHEPCGLVCRCCHSDFRIFFPSPLFVWVDRNSRWVRRSGAPTDGYRFVD